MSGAGRNRIAGIAQNPAEYSAGLDRKPMQLKLDTDRQHYLEGFRRVGLNQGV
jgi:hypothetical protein